MLILASPHETPAHAMDAKEIPQIRLDLALFRAADNGTHAQEADRIELIINLYEAIGQSNVERAEELLKAGAEFGDIAKKLYRPYTPITLAINGPISEKCIELCKLLLDYGAQIDEPSGENEYTPLMQAAIDGRTKICKFLLDKGANMLARDNANNTALLLVAKKYTDFRNHFTRKPIGSLQPRRIDASWVDPIWIECMDNLKATAQFLVAYQKEQEKNMFTLLACLRYNSLPALCELYRQRNGLLVPYLKQYLLNSLLEAKNNDGKTIYDYE